MVRDVELSALGCVLLEVVGTRLTIARDHHDQKRIRRAFFTKGEEQKANQRQSGSGGKSKYCSLEARLQNVALTALLALPLHQQKKCLC